MTKSKSIVMLLTSLKKETYKVHDTVQAKYKVQINDTTLKTVIA